MNYKQIALKIAFVACLILCMTPWISAPIALVGGFLFSLLFGNPFATFTHKATSKLLKLSVIGLGFGMQAESAIKAGSEGLWLTIASITLTLSLGYLIGRKALRMPPRLSHLIASGTAICGGSAIAAVAPAVNASEDETTMSLGVVFLLNSLALIIFPILGNAFGLTQHQFGLWSAIAIHDTSSVVGAASAYGAEALDVATTVKLARALWIIPVSLLSAFIFKSKGKKIQIPWFIFLFIVAIILNSYIPFVGQYGHYVASVSKRALVATLFLIGLSLSVSSIKRVGVKPIILGVSLWLTISVLSLVAIVNM